MVSDNVRTVQTLGQIIIVKTSSGALTATLVVQCIAVTVALASAGVALWIVRSNRRHESRRAARQVVFKYSEWHDPHLGMQVGRVDLVNASEEMIVDVRV